MSCRQTLSDIDIITVARACDVEAIICTCCDIVLKFTVAFSFTLSDAIAPSHSEGRKLCGDAR